MEEQEPPTSDDAIQSQLAFARSEESKTHRQSRARNWTHTVFAVLTLVIVSLMFVDIRATQSDGHQTLGSLQAEVKTLQQST